MADDMRKHQQLPDYVQTVTIRDAKGSEKILVLPKALDLERPKRSRTAFTKWQVDLLEDSFHLNPYLVGEQRAALAGKLQLSETQVKVWFQNRRTKERKERGQVGDRPKTSDNSSAAEQKPSSYNSQVLPLPHYAFYYDLVHNMQSFQQ